MFIATSDGDTSELRLFDLDGTPLRLMIRKIEIAPMTEGVVSAVLTVDYVTLGLPPKTN